MSTVGITSTTTTAALMLISLSLPALAATAMHCAVGEPPAAPES